MEDSLDFDNILEPDQIESLFDEGGSQGDGNIESIEDNTENITKEKQEKDQTTEVNTEELFVNEPESVGSEQDDIKEKEDTQLQNNGTSPKKNFYSSIAKALQEEGIFPDLEDDSFSSIKNPEDLRDLVEQQIRAGLDERQQRIEDALNAGVETSEIKQYENTIDFLDNIQEDALSDESDKGEKLRKNLIFQDFINRGFSKERASREVQRSLDSGTDIDDAKEALKSNLEYFKDKYDNLIKDAQAETKRQEKERERQVQQLKESVFNENDMFKGLSINKSTRQRVYDNITKPVYKDQESGQYYTAIQKYEKEHKLEFMKNVGILFTVTNGFKSIDDLVKGKVRREVKKGLRELENTLNNTSRTFDGNLNFANGFDDTESFDKGWKLDV